MFAISDDKTKILMPLNLEIFKTNKTPPIFLLSPIQSGRLTDNEDIINELFAFRRAPMF